MPSHHYNIMRHDREHKLCPIISTPDHVVPCQGPHCQLWTSVMTTADQKLYGGARQYGCAYELQPNINMDGRFNV